MTLAESFNLPEPQFLHPENGMPRSYEDYMGQSMLGPIEVGGLHVQRRKKTEVDARKPGSLNTQAFLNVLLSLQTSNPGGPEGGM